MGEGGRGRIGVARGGAVDRRRIGDRALVADGPAVWSQFTRFIVGAFHQISKKHLDRYIEEMEWRFNNRNKPHMFRDAVKRILTNDPLRYRELVDKKAA